MTAWRWPGPLGALTVDGTDTRLFTRGYSATPGPLVVNRVPSARLLLCLCALGFALSASAVDNPDAPDHIGEFRQRSAPFEQAVSEAAGGAASAELGDWIEFLETELTQTEDALSAALPDSERSRLQRAQATWREQTIADEALARAVWTHERVGSSASLALGLERAAALQQRVELLLRMRGAMFADAE
jgi:hypothetical protein